MRVWEMSHQREKYYKGWPKTRRLEMVMLRPSVMTIYKPIKISQIGEGKVTRMISERIVKGARYSGPWLIFGHQVRCENINNIMPIHKPIVCTWIAVLMLLTRFTMARKSTPAAAANALGSLHWAVEQGSWWDRFPLGSPKHPVRTGALALTVGITATCFELSNVPM